MTNGIKHRASKLEKSVLSCVENEAEASPSPHIKAKSGRSKAILHSKNIQVIHASTF